MSRAFVFPGQGSQAVGMGHSLAEAFSAAREVFEEVDDALSQNLFRLMVEGPEDELMLTENAQPALMAVSMAVVRVLQSEGNLDIADAASCVAGHSLGEYSALAAARSLTVPDVARLLKTRGQAMQQAVPLGEGAWLRCWASGWKRRRKSPTPPLKEMFARPPTITARIRSCCPVRLPRSPGQLKLRRIMARAALCRYRSAHHFIVL